MPCRPGNRLRIGEVEWATASAIILDHGRAWVVTAGHACSAYLGRRAEYWEDGHWKALGRVVNALDDETYDCGAIEVDAAVAVTRVPIGGTQPLKSLPYIDLDRIKNKSFESFLGASNRALTGSVTEVVFNDSDVHRVNATPEANQAPGNNGDSGSPLIVEHNGSKVLAGIFVKLPPGERVMKFFHPTPALNLMELPIP